MAVKASTAKQKVTGKAGAAAKPAAKRKYAKGSTMACSVCGLSVVVEQVGDLAIGEESLILCCDEPMKKKTPKTKTAKPAKK